MNVDDLISRATHTTGRSLIAVSSAVLLSKYFDHELAKFPILATAEGMPAKMVSVAAFSLLIYLCFAHFLNWYNDFKGYQAGDLIKVWKEQKSADEGIGAILLESAPERTMPYDKLLIEHKHVITATRWAQWLALFGQHLGLPLFMAALALLSFFITKSAS